MPQTSVIHFHSHQYQLVGTLHMPDVSSPPAVIGCHGLLANRESQKQIELAKACNLAGLAYFRFDHRGCGESQGDFNSVTSLSNRCRDLESALHTIQDHPGISAEPIGLFGSSFGGTVALTVAGYHNIEAIATYAAPINSSTINHRSIRDKNNQTPTISSSLAEALHFDIEDRLSAVRNLYVLHSHADETVPVDHARRIHHAAQQPKKILVFDGGDHRMSEPSHQKRFIVETIQWFKAHGF